MALKDCVKVVRRYQRAIRINTDLHDPAALEGYVCPRSSAEALGTMARHLREAGQAAFTWTGPYGSGKSSLVIALAAALSGDEERRKEAASILGKETTARLWEALPPRKRGWRMLPVVGRRGNSAQVIGEALQAARLVRKNVPNEWDENRLLATLEGLASKYPRVGGGLVIFVDEMGKLLEAAAEDGSDIYLFQQLAETASRSDGRLVVVGILHQAFEEYAHRLSREMRDEWSKIQGRFVDLVINAADDEQIDLLARAIQRDRRPKRKNTLARLVVRQMQRRITPELPNTLNACWPLHPVVACLLGPVSRRRFGQNQRSIFSFLNSAEPQGFQDFLRSANERDLYRVDQLWNYLRINLEPAILASPDGHRWALAINVLDRCEPVGGEDLHVRLLKAIATIDMLKDRSGLIASTELLKLALDDCDPEQIDAALDDLQRWRLVIFRKFTNAYSVFEGSDFDISEAIDQALEETRELDLFSFDALPNLQPIVAKRHYHETGALRWFDVELVPTAAVSNVVERYEPKHGAIGAFLLTIPTQGELESEVRKTCRIASEKACAWDIVVGISQSARKIPALVHELIALERVRKTTPELQGDRVARIEVRGRIAAVQSRLESEVSAAFDGAHWYCKGSKPNSLMHAELNSLASSLADVRFSEAPKLRNELVVRVRPSSNAIAARNALLRRMALNEREPRLGISGFPAEGGLYVSLLEATELHKETAEGWRFVSPTDISCDPYKLVPAWKKAIEHLRESSYRTVSLSEIYDIWRAPPFGIKDGLLPVLAVAFLMTQSGSLAYYRDRIFQARLSDLDIDYLIRDPNDIQVRWMDLSANSRRLLSSMADIVRDLDSENTLINLQPIDVAKGLVAIYDRLPLWVGRTQRLSSTAKRLRQLFKQANDPNKLVFDDIPNVLATDSSDGDKVATERIAKQVCDGLIELQQAYPAMLHRLRDILLAELQVPNTSEATLAELRERATNIRELGGDHRLEAFIVRIAQFRGTNVDVEGLAGLAVNKPPQTWVDTDIDRAEVGLAELAQSFLRVETFARVKGRRDKRHSMAVIVGMDGRPTPVHDEFQIADQDHGEVDALIERVDQSLRESGVERRNIILAALAELSARYLDPREEQKRKIRQKNKRVAS